MDNVRNFYLYTKNELELINPINLKFGDIFYYQEPASENIKGPFKACSDWMVKENGPGMIITDNPIEVTFTFPEYKLNI